MILVTSSGFRFDSPRLMIKMRVSLLDAAGEMEKFLSSELDSSKEIE